MPDLGNTGVFSQTDASNGSGTQPSWLGSAAPSTLDDAGRALQGAITRDWNWRNYTVTATGTADAKVLTYSATPAAYYNGQRFSFIANTTNATTTPTLNVNALGAVTIKTARTGTIANLAIGDMVAGQFVEVAYNTANTCFVWVNQVGILANIANTFTATQTFADSNLILNNNIDYQPQIQANHAGATVASAPYFMARRARGTYTVPTIVQNGDVLGNLYFGGYDGATYQSAAIINVSVDGTPGAGDMPGRIVFSTTPDGSSGALERVRIDNAGNALVTSSGGLGYGTGSGGTVTQLTSKTTGVTLNKTNGNIITHNAALAAGASAMFTFTNSTMAASDVVIVNPTNGNYRARANNNSTGSMTITLTNESGGSLSDAVQIQFAIIKAVTA